jgi:hypothetical protein
MIVQAYIVESRRHGSIDDVQPAPVPVGAVQFTGNIAQERGEAVAMELLSRFSPLTRHPILIYVIQESLRSVPNLIIVNHTSVPGNGVYHNSNSLERDLLLDDIVRCSGLYLWSSSPLWLLLLLAD